MLELDKEALLKLDEIFNRLAVLNVKWVVVECYGGGDEGTIETPTFLDTNDRPFDIEPSVFKRDVAEISNTVIEGTGVDYYNNEGGRGDVTWDIRNKTIKVRMYCYEQVAIDAAEGEFNLTEALKEAKNGTHEH